MIQFYFLSIFFNLLAGYALVSGRQANRAPSPAFAHLRLFFRDPTLRLLLGILVAVTGAFKLIAVVRGDIPIVGDFLPAFMGLCLGATMLLELYRSPAAAKLFAGEGEEAPGDPETAPPAQEAAEGPAPDRGEGEDAAGEPPLPLSLPGALERFLLERREAIGIAGLIAALVHFLFPMVILL